MRLCEKSKVSLQVSCQVAIEIQAWTSLVVQQLALPFNIGDVGLIPVWEAKVPYVS